MKKITFVLAVVAMFVTFAACNKEADTQITEGNSIEAVFEVSAPELATKAISDGLTATKLFFYLYDQGGKLLFETNSSVAVDPTYPVTFTKLADKKWSVKVRLIKDMQYQVVFWAQKPDADAFTLNAAAKTLSVNYSDMTLNADDEDAFWGTVGTDPADPFIVTGPATKVVTLKRPFAQLNVAIPAEDLGVASFMLGKYSKSVADITTNYTLSSYAYNTMNLLDGTVSDNAASSGLTLVAQAKPDADITIGDKTYKHMAMAYVLVGSEKVINDVTLTVNTGASAIGSEGVLTRDVLNVPLQRNYRTNIIGNIFSVEEEFTVEVDNAFGETGTGAYGDVNVPDYVPTFGSIDALNAELAKGVDAVALDIAAGTKITGNIELPNTTNDIHLYILNDHMADESAINVVYTDGAAAHPANLYVYAKKLYHMDGTVPDTHVEVYSYSYIHTGTISTSGTTLVIQPFAYYGNLRILKGGLKIEGIKDAEGNYEKDDNGNDAKGYVSMVVVEVPSEEAVQNVNIVNNGYLGGTDINAGIIVISGSSAVEGDVTVSNSAQATVNAAVEGNVAVTGSADIEVNASVSGNVTASDDSTLSLGEDAVVGGDVEQKDNAEVSIDGGATIEGEVTAEDDDNVSYSGALCTLYTPYTDAEVDGSMNVTVNPKRADVQENIALSVALSQAQPGQVIELIGNTTVSKNIEIPAGVILDFNGYTLDAPKVIGKGGKAVLKQSKHSSDPDEENAIAHTISLTGTVENVEIRGGSYAFNPATYTPNGVGEVTGPVTIDDVDYYYVPSVPEAHIFYADKAILDALAPGGYEVSMFNTDINEDGVSLDWNGPTVKVNDYGVYVFQMDENESMFTTSVYENWYADYVFSVNRDTEGETFGIWGQYANMTFGFKMLPQIPQGVIIPMLGMTGFLRQYSQIRNDVNTFLCGPYVFSEPTTDPTILSVELRMFKSGDYAEKLNNEGFKDYILIQRYDYEMHEL